MLRPHCEDVPNKGLMKYQLSELILLQFYYVFMHSEEKNQGGTIIQVGHNLNKYVIFNRLKNVLICKYMNYSVLREQPAG